MNQLACFFHKKEYLQIKHGVRPPALYSAMPAIDKNKTTAAIRFKSTNYGGLALGVISFFLRLRQP